MQTTQLRFPAGQLVLTPGALAAFARNASGPDYFHLLTRHLSGDWGDVSADDASENEYSVSRHLRILSAYHLADGTKVWFITEADRSATTALRPEEY
ncbi:MAG TPA: hypothetical protein VKX16_03975 [Chloroflexota bacterium]|nr:hypothetical protein [Chloroflexota bacterium]